MSASADRIASAVLSSVASIVSESCEKLRPSEDLVKAALAAAAAAATASLKSGSSAKDAARVGIFTGIVTAGGSESMAETAGESHESARLERSRSFSVASVLGRSSGHWGLLGRVLADVVRDTCGVEMFERLEKILAVCTAFRSASSTEAESMKTQLAELCAGTAAQVSLEGAAW